MRTAIIMGLLTLFLGGVLYFFVLRDREDVFIEDLAGPATTNKMVPTTVPNLDTQMPVGRSSGVRAETIDSRGRVLNSFSSQDVVPRADGSVDVVKPEAFFYGKTGGIVRLNGSEGHVFYTQAGSKENTQSLGTSTPTSGDLKDVTIRFYEHSLDEEPSIVVVVPAVRFDSNSNRITTIDCIVNGQGVAAEQVPVTMTGRDFDFEGQGLSVAWNDREGMLDQLEILRGNRLLVRDVSRFVGEEMAAGTMRTTRTPLAPQAPTISMALFGVMQVDSPVPSANTEQTPDTSKDLYHATFDRDVHILKDGMEIATGDVLRCVIPLGGSRKNTEATNTSEDRPKPATRKAKPEAVRADAQPTSTPTTQPIPMEIRWNGKLTVRPVKLVPEAPHAAMVEIVGAPARVAENGAVATGRLIHIEPDAGRVRIEPGGNIRAIEVKDASGAEIRSRSILSIDQIGGVATIDGGGALTVPPSETQKSAVQVQWSKKLTLSMAPGEFQFLQSIEVDGDAKVDSEQLKLECGRLELGFDAPVRPSAQGSSRLSMPSPDLSLLRVVHARGDARCDLGSGDSSRTLSAQNIQLGFVAGDDDDALLNAILCDGEVKLIDSNGLDLSAGNLSVQTKPISLARSETQPNSDFFDLVLGFSAQTDVTIRRADGSSVVGDEVQLSGKGADQRLFASGTPAFVSSPKGSLIAQDIELDPATGDVSVPGPGKFAGTNPDRPGTNIDIAWTESMNVDGKTGECTLSGAVHINGIDDKGAHLVADAARGRMQFETKPPADGQAPSGLSGVTMDSIRSLTLDGGVVLSVDTQDARSSSMETPQLTVDLVNGTLDAPEPGRMLVIDRRKDASTGQSKFGPGALAMRWNEALTWDMRGGNLSLLGGVRIGFEREGESGPVRITCNRLDGTLTPLDTSSGFDQMTPKIDLKMLRAQGDVMVRSSEASFDCADLVYDLFAQRATAKGTDLKPVEVLNAAGTSRIGFSSVVWNLETGKVEDLRDVSGQIRQ